MQIFFTSGVGSDILMNGLEDCIIFCLWPDWVLFNFYLKQKQRSGALLKILSSPFMEKFGPDIQK